MIDAHVHFWQYEPIKDAWIADHMATIKRDFVPLDLETELKLNGVKGCVAVQADQSENETQFLLAYAEQYPFIKGVVGWIDFRSKHLPERLAFFAEFNKIKGWRHIRSGGTKRVFKSIELFAWHSRIRTIRTYV